jgi:hypothetical protein
MYFLVVAVVLLHKIFKSVQLNSLVWKAHRLAGVFPFSPLKKLKVYDLRLLFEIIV